jgi:hypothetical protein
MLGYDFYNYGEKQSTKNCGTAPHMMVFVSVSAKTK